MVCFKDLLLFLFYVNDLKYSSDLLDTMLFLDNMIYLKKDKIVFNCQQITRKYKSMVHLW